MLAAYPVPARWRQEGGPEGGESHLVIGEYSLSRRPRAHCPTDRTKKEKKEKSPTKVPDWLKAAVKRGTPLCKMHKIPGSMQI